MTMRTVTYFGTVALLSQIVWTQGCGSNAPATTAGAGGAPALGGATETTSTGGTSAMGGTVATTTVASTGGSTMPVTTPGTGGNTGAGGATASSAFQPLCAGLTTAAGAAPTKNGLCTATDPQLCYKTCGPQSLGFKSETCTAGAYAESSSCGYPSGDYSCYKIPTTVDPTCPTTAPQASSACSVAPCTLCNVSGGYLDSTGAAKTGFCVCPASTSGTGKWSCASTTAWPCPQGNGC